MISTTKATTGYDKDFASTVVELSKVNMLHVFVVISEQVNASNINNILEKMQVLYDLESEIDTYQSHHNQDCTSAGVDEGILSPRRLFITLQFSHNSLFLVNALLKLDFHFDLWILNVEGNKQLAAANVEKIHELIKASSKSTALGIGDFKDSLELDWLLCKIPRGALQFVHLGDLQLPDLRTHCIELSHTMGLNTLFNISSKHLEDEIMKSAQLQELAAKYQIFPDTFLVKCLLQLGCITAIPLSFLHQDYVEEHYSRLCHPFVHRKAFVSANKVISLLIQASDVAVPM